MWSRRTQLRTTRHLPRVARLIVPLAVTTAGIVSLADGVDAREFPTTPEDVSIVDCLLPGQVRRVGKIKGFLTQRRPARLSQFECAFRGGEFVDFDRATLSSSVQVWQASADAGDVEAMVILGEAYAKGLDRASDYTEARAWFEKAASEGSRKALQNLGHLYESGLGVAQDPERALHYFRRALGGEAEALVYSSDALRAAELREELEMLRLREKQSAGELERLRSTLSERSQELDQSVRALRELRGEYESLRGSRSTPSADGVWRVLEEQLREREDQIAAKQNEIEGLRSDLGSTSNEPYVLIGPELTLKFDRPVIVAARGRPVAIFDAPASTLMLRGSAQPADAVAELRVDGNLVTVDRVGAFEVPLSADGERKVVVEARSRSGKETRAEFLLLPRGVAQSSPPTVNDVRPAPSVLRKGRLRALLIAVSGYRDYPGLPTPQADAELVAGVLQDRFGFSAQILRDPTRVDLLLALHAFRQSLGTEDSGLIYFAGHGEIGADKEGYWLPSDALEGRPESWISNRVITDMIAVSESRHLLVVADSCYSGTLTRLATAVPTETLPTESWRVWAEASAAGKSRVAITSGGLRPVPEAGEVGVSAFARAIATVLNEAEGTLEAQRLYREVSQRLRAEPTAIAFQQRPEMAPMQFAGHERGELFFVPVSVR